MLSDAQVELISGLVETAIIQMKRDKREKILNRQIQTTLTPNGGLVQAKLLVQFAERPCDWCSIPDDVTTVYLCGPGDVEKRKRHLCRPCRTGAAVRYP